MGRGRVTLLDAFAVIAYLHDDPAGSEVQQLIRAGDCAMATANYTEVVDREVRVHDIPEAQAIEGLSAFIENLVELRPLTEATAVRAGRLRAAHYDRNPSALSLADCILLATAVPGTDRITTSDPAVATVARAEGIDLIPLPDSNGARPE